MPAKSRIDRKGLGDRVTELVAAGCSTREIARQLPDDIDHTMVHRWMKANLGSIDDVRAEMKRSFKSSVRKSGATGQKFLDGLLAVLDEARTIMNNPGEQARVREKALEVAAAAAIEGFNMSSFQLQIENIVQASGAKR